MHRIRTLVVAGVAALALVAVVPVAASAADEKSPPVDKNGKKYCPIKALDGSVTWEPHGTTITMTWPNGTSRTNICVDGEWKDARLASVTGIRVNVDSAYLDASGSLVLAPTTSPGTVRGG
jgi:hypothetical protein